MAPPFPRPLPPLPLPVMFEGVRKVVEGCEDRLQKKACGLLLVKLSLSRVCLAAKCHFLPSSPCIILYFLSGIPIKPFNLAPVITDYIKPAPTVIDTHLLLAQLLTLAVAHLLHSTRNHVRSRQRKNSRQEVSEQIQQGRSAVPSGQDCTVP